MTSFRYAIALAVLIAGCASTGSPANTQRAQHMPTETETDTCVPRPGCVSNPPVFMVGVTDPNTELILPWFLTDIINAINAHGSSTDCCIR